MAGPSEDFEIRSLESEAEYRACLDLQQETWGDDMLGCVPPLLLQITQKVGGVAAGAFDGDGGLVGFVYGISGFRHGAPAHWSHMLAIREGLRDRGLGRRLKLWQRRRVAELGIETMYWTYDPLEARNAFFNFQRLGVELDEYVRDCYGSGDDSPLHAGIGTDRFIVRWRFPPGAEESVAPTLDPAAMAHLPILNTHQGEGGEIEPREGEALRGPGRIEIPQRIQIVKAETPGLGARWRRCTRQAFEAGIAQGLAVRSFYRDRDTGRCFYHLG